MLNGGINIDISPRLFPIIGAWKSRHYQGKEVAKPFLGLKKYGWGGEQLSIKLMQVPSPYSRYTFKLIVQDKQSYQLYYNGKYLLTGRVGKIAKTPELPAFSIDIDKLIARPGEEFYIHYNSSPTRKVMIF